MDGDHDVDACFEATEATLREVYYQLGTQGVALEGTLLKPNMVLSGKDAGNRAGPEEVAEKTVSCFKRTVPAAVPGIVFLSGGQSDEEATVNLDAINRHAASVGAPWELSFSYGRGLQAAPLKAWGGGPGQSGPSAAGVPTQGLCHQCRPAGYLHARDGEGAGRDVREAGLPSVA